MPWLNHGFGGLSRWGGGLIALVLLCIGAQCAMGVTVDSPEVKPQAILHDAPVLLASPHSAVDDFRDSQEQFWAAALWILAACVFAVVIGTVAALLLLLTVRLLTGLVAAGVVSASVVIGVMRRSVSTGFRALFFQIGAGLGLVLGSLGAWTFLLLAKLPMNSVQPWVIGPLVGVAFGLLAAWMFNFAWGRSVEWIVRKLPGKKVVEVEGEKVVDINSKHDE